MIKTVGIVAKYGSSSSYDIARKVIEYGTKVLGLEMLVDEGISMHIGWRKTFRVGVDSVDMIMVIGGDGTLFRTLHRLGESDTPIMTVKMGKRGFLLDVHPDEVLDRLKDVVEGRFSIVEYMKLDTYVYGRYERRLPQALNDVVITNTASMRTKVVRLSISIDGEEVYKLYGDGIIVATPQGSSGYSLSAGGPLVDVYLNSIIVTPLAPIQLSLRPIVLASTRIVDIRVSEDSAPAVCIVDGQSMDIVHPGESVKIAKAKSSAKIIRFRVVNSYEKLRASE